MTDDTRPDKIAPHPDGTLYAARRVADAFAALWWEIVYTTRADRAVHRIAALLPPREEP